MNCTCFIVHPIHCCLQKRVHDSRIAIANQDECKVRNEVADEESDLAEENDGDEDEDGDVDVDIEGDEDARRSATVAEGIAEIEVGVTLMTLCAVGALSTALPIVQKYRYKS